jgi:hypothetical protein
MSPVYSVTHLAGLDPPRPSPTRREGSSGRFGRAPPRWRRMGCPSVSRRASRSRTAVTSVCA